MNKINRKFKPAATDRGDAAGDTQPAMQNAADSMHALLVTRADALMGCTEGSAEEEEFARLTDVIEAYEAIRWPEGKIPGGKG